MVNDTTQMLLDELRDLRAEYTEMRTKLAWLVGRYDRDGLIPVREIEDLLGMERES